MDVLLNLYWFWGYVLVLIGRFPANMGNQGFFNIQLLKNVSIPMMLDQ